MPTAILSAAALCFVAPVSRQAASAVATSTPVMVTAVPRAVAAAKRALATRTEPDGAATPGAVGDCFAGGWASKPTDPLPPQQVAQALGGSGPPLPIDGICDLVVGSRDPLPQLVALACGGSAYLWSSARSAGESQNKKPSCSAGTRCMYTTIFGLFAAKKKWFPRRANIHDFGHRHSHAARRGARTHPHTLRLLT